MRGIYDARGSRLGSNVSLPTPMIAFDADGFANLASLMFSRERNARRDVVAQMAEEGYQSIQAELELLSGVIEESRGAFFDLRESFDRVNATYFGGAMNRPRLTWSRSFTGRKFGHYDWIMDTVMVSRTLDSGDVPEFLVDFIVYHELLHKKHGLHWVNGRGYAHTTEFYREERQFSHYQESETLLGQLARGSARITRQRVFGLRSGQWISGSFLQRVGVAAACESQCSGFERRGEVEFVPITFERARQRLSIRVSGHRVGRPQE